MMPSFALLSALVAIGALFSFLSYKVLRLPTTIGTMVLSLTAASALLLSGHAVPVLREYAKLLVSGIDFNQAVLHGMLAFLLFAGALQLDLKQLTRERVSVLTLAVFATAISTVIVAFLFKGALHLVGIQISTMEALLFGALISPTDPIAVLEMLQRVGAPPELSIQLAGESLFNDGVGAVIFVALLGASATSSAHHGLPSPITFAGLLLVEAGGGIALGLTLGFLTYRLIRMVDSYRVEVMLTLALAMGGYVVADPIFDSLFSAITTQRLDCPVFCFRPSVLYIARTWFRRQPGKGDGSETQRVRYSGRCRGCNANHCPRSPIPLKKEAKAGCRCAGHLVCSLGSSSIGAGGGRKYIFVGRDGSGC
jgi:CPA1 family monovalent cation:H+ antiporter